MNYPTSESHDSSPIEIFKPAMISPLLVRVYAWMMIGLFITGATSFFVGVFAPYILFFKAILPILFIAEVLTVIAIGAVARRVPAPVTILLFLFYSFLNGLTLSFIFMVYTMGSIALAFGISAGMFGIMAIYGYVTKQDLTRIGSFAVMGLIGIFIASLINIFLQSPIITWVWTYVGMGIFLILTAWDMQKIKKMAELSDESEIDKVAIIGALELYLDFINIFIRVLQIIGKRK